MKFKVIQFAKEESDVVLKMKGKYVKKERPGYKCVPMVSGKPGKKKVEKRVRQGNRIKKSSINFSNRQHEAQQGTLCGGSSTREDRHTDPAVPELSGVQRSEVLRSEEMRFC